MGVRDEVHIDLTTTPDGGERWGTHWPYYDSWWGWEMGYTLTLLRLMMRVRDGVYNDLSGHEGVQLNPRTSGDNQNCTKDPVYDEQWIIKAKYMFHNLHKQHWTTNEEHRADDICNYSHIKQKCPTSLYNKNPIM